MNINQTKPRVINCPLIRTNSPTQNTDHSANIPGDQKVSVHLHSVYSNNPHTIDELKMAITEYIRNVDLAILNTVFENTVPRVNKCLETSGGHFEHYL